MASARLATPLPANGPREHWARARLTWADGGLIASPMTDQDSSLVGIFASADGLVRLPVGAPAAPAGSVVDVLLLERMKGIEPSS
jgi:molybdopterin molybdotransferase